MEMENEPTDYQVLIDHLSILIDHLSNKLRSQRCEIDSYRSKIMDLEDELEVKKALINNLKLDPPQLFN